MDYEALSMLIPKPVYQWSFLQVRKWLHFIHMQRFIPIFEKLQFNGQSLLKTNHKNLLQIGITSNIMQRKLIIWIQKGFLQFNSYLQNQSKNKQNCCPNINARKTARQLKNKPKIQIQMPQLMQIQQPEHNKPSYFTLSAPKLKITSFQGSKNVYYIADHKGLKIGRALNNEIQSLQVSVQNYHAKICLQNNNFHLMDLGTKNGTFIKIHHKIQLRENMLIQIGSYLFKIEKMINHNKQIIIKYINLINNQDKQTLNIDFNSKQYFSFGRRNTNDWYKDDQHMSGTHAKIYYLNGKFILQDIQSTNGTWFRLSQYKHKSQPYKLEDGQIFKIGNTITYICTYQNGNYNDNNKMQIEQQNVHLCTQCQTSQRNILFLPCKHTVNCENCSQDISICPLCRHDIEQKVKIFI